MSWYSGAANSSKKIKSSLPVFFDVVACHSRYKADIVGAKIHGAGVFFRVEDRHAALTFDPELPLAHVGLYRFEANPVERDFQTKAMAWKANELSFAHRRNGNSMRNNRNQPAYILKRSSHLLNFTLDHCC